MSDVYKRQYKDKKLTEKTGLYAAPFFNVTGANVCLGSAKIDKPRDLTLSLIHISIPFNRLSLTRGNVDSEDLVSCQYPCFLA